ncbi:MAG: AAA family ATPase [Mariniphaga sp.]|nr:AAA family ATPase [Mariniphaga sp.]
MERLTLEKLKTWKKKSKRKPLLLKGARQVGKTWLMKEFGKNEYDKTAYVNFESSKALQSLFKDDYNIDRIITALQIETGTQIDAGNTLILLDEIQEAEGGITALKYFCENAPQYNVIAAGSLLGVALQKNTSFPVGKVDFLDLHPMSFIEFLMATGQQSLVGLLQQQDWQLIKTFRTKYIELLRHYYFVGGMPEAVYSFSTKNDFQEVREIQKSILSAFELDFSKHAPIEIVPRIRLLWNSIPSQLAKENKKFIYRAIRPGTRAKDYELALSWLIDCGLVHKISRVSKPGIPLKSYEDISAFKLFIADVGLLAATGDIDAKTLLDGSAVFNEFKGALTEQYVLQQLKAETNLAIYYWSAERSASEIDFLIQSGSYVIPIEVKAEENLQAKSLKVFYQKYNPVKAVRTSMSDYRDDNWLLNIPLFAIGNLPVLISS